MELGDLESLEMELDKWRGQVPLAQGVTMVDEFFLGGNIGKL